MSLSKLCILVTALMFCVSSCKEGGISSKEEPGTILKELVTTSDDYRYYAVSKVLKGDTLKGVEDLNGNVIVPTKMIEIDYCYRYNRGDSELPRDGFDKDEFRRFNCKYAGEKSWTESYKIDGTCVIGHERGYKDIWLYGGTCDDYQFLNYFVMTEDSIWGLCDSEGREIAFPQFIEPSSYENIYIHDIKRNMKKDDYGDIVFSDAVYILEKTRGVCVYNSKGNCVISSDNEYRSIGINKWAHTSFDDDNCFYFCRRKDMGTDVRNAKGKIICRASGTAAIKAIKPDTDSYESYQEARYYYYIVGGSKWDTINGRLNHPYYSHLDYRYGSCGNLHSYSSDEEQRFNLYDISGNVIDSYFGEFLGLSYDETNGFYYSSGNSRSWEDNKVYLNKWLDANMHVTDEKPRMNKENSSIDIKPNPTPTPNPIPPQPRPMQVWVKCFACDGSGQCHTCLGLGHSLSGTDRCWNCGGSGRCTQCAGQGGHYEVQYY